MYHYCNVQISLKDFRQSINTNLRAGNRWGKKAQMIPWLEIEKKYAARFTNRKGNVAKALGACIIQAEYGHLWHDLSVIDGKLSLGKELTKW